VLISGHFHVLDMQTSRNFAIATSRLTLHWKQWRTQKTCVLGALFSEIWWSFVFGVRCLWRHTCHIHVSKPIFWRSLLTQYAYSSTHTPFILCVIALNLNYQHSKLGYPGEK